MRFTGLTLELETPLHIGAGRGGMLARGHGFVPGHVVSYALAAAIGKANGGQYPHFTAALQTVLSETRCGPLFVIEQSGALLPRRDRERIERHYLTARNHVTLDPEVGSAVESALFEVESIAVRALHGPQRGQPVRLVGGFWHGDAENLAGKPFQHWFSSGLLLGGELKTGLGRIRQATLAPNAQQYALRWPVNGEGLKLNAGDILPGPSLNGGADAPLQPWLGRLFDEKQGFGRRFPGAALVRLDARCTDPGWYLPAATEDGLGCWQRGDAPAD